MYETFYERLHSAGYLRRRTVNNSQIFRSSKKELIDLAESLCELTSAESIGRDQPLLAHSASLSLGGGRNYCAYIQCRLNRSYELAQFALLYSDRVYIRNFLYDFIPHWGYMDWPEAELRQAFVNDLVILNQLRPVIEKGIIIPFSPPSSYCPHCLTIQVLGTDASKRLRKQHKQLLRRFSKDISANLLWNGERYGLEIYGPLSLTDHSILEYFEAPTILFHTPKLIKKVHSKKIVPLSHTILNKLGLNSDLASRVIENIAFELYSSQSFNTSFLTEHPLEIEILNSISENPELEKRNQIAQKYLTSFVPFLNGVKISDLISLRQKEQEAFIAYRQMLNRAIDEYKAQTKTFTKKDAKEIYSDIIAPKLAELDRKVKNAQKNLLKTTTRSIISWVGAISFGIYAGFIPQDLITAAQALGLTKVVADLLEKVMHRSDANHFARNEEIYFLWKVRQRSSF